ncbi:DNA-directed DNA polymerase eta rad30 [Xylographa pallens]|nr:DNA-directed DNA polymerase eta rad30 [Xylographa pallens]
MSSSQPFLPSSPLSQLHSGGRLRKSRFTYKHLSQLSLFSTTCPLRVIAHIDLDAFYAQCEMVRLNVPEDQPLAVQQWQGLIAINYPARKFGMNRHITITEAKKLCPNLIMQHVATWKEGDEKWAYHKDAFAQIATHKVSLDPYRLESRRILACIKETLPAAPLQRVEKASVDEVFLDLSAQIHSILLEQFPELSGPPPYDDPNENLPRPPTTALDWNTDALVDLDNTETEDDDPDWDDIAIQIGSEIVRGVRAAIRERLKYTCSAGIAHNKMIAKLGSAHKKPNQQTIVRNRAIQQFLSGFKFTKIRNLGGKLGDQVVSTFGTDQVTELLEVSIEQLKFKLGDDTGSWVYQIIRGEEYSEVNSRTQIKSMLSAKSFRPSINTFEQAVRWLRIFAADIFSRLVEEGVLENKRRPKTMNLHHRQGGQMRSRQAPIPSGRSIDEALLFEISKTLLGQVIVDGRAWPCANLSLSVGGFEDGPTGNRGIGGFLVKGDEARAMRPTSRDVENQDSTLESGRLGKRRKVDEGGIQKFFAKRDSSRGEHDDEFGADEEAPVFLHRSSSLADLETPTGEKEGQEMQNQNDEKDDLAIDLDIQKSNETTSTNGPPSNIPSHQTSIATYLCTKCNTPLPAANKAEHEDWHFAKDLQAVDRPTAVGSSGTKPPPAAPNGGGSKKPATVGAKRGPKKPGGATEGKGVEKGQKRLVFGR